MHGSTLGLRMKRRAIVAVLFVFALATPVSIGCGGANRQDPEATKGKPWTGSEGQSVSVRRLASSRSKVHIASAEVRERDGDAEAARQSVGPNVREKPEPGEETGPPKRAGPSVALRRTGKAAIAPSQAVTADGDFLGAQLSQSGF